MKNGKKKQRKRKERKSKERYLDNLNNLTEIRSKKN
jgi:hypothetical protein